MRRHQRIFFIWLLSYGLVLVLPIVGILVAFRQSNRVIVEEIKNGHRASLMQIKHILDGELADIDELSLEIGWNPLTESLMNRTLPLNEWDRFNIFQFHRFALIYSAVNTMVEDFFIYLPNTDMVITSQNMYSSLHDYRRFFHAEQDPETFFETVTSFHRGRITALEDRPDSESDLYWIRSFPVADRDGILADLALRLNREYIDRVITDNSWMPEVDIGVVDPQGHTLACSKCNAPEIGPYLGPDVPDDSIVPVNGSRHMLSLARSDKADWIYYSLIPENIFLRQARKARSTLIVSLTVSYLIAYTILVWITERHYKPIRSLVTTLPGSENTDDDELTAIHKSVAQLLENQFAGLRIRFLRKLITSRFADPEVVRAGIQKYRFDFENRHFLVSLIHVESALEESAGTIPVESLTDRIHTEFANTEHYVVDQTEMLTLLFVVDQEDYRAEIGPSSSRLIRNLGLEFGLNTAIVFSGLTDSPFRLAVAYHEAKNLLESELFRGNRGLVFYADQNGQPRDYTYSLKLEIQFLNAVRASQFSKAQQVLEEELDRIGKAHTDCWVLKTKAMGIISLVLDALGELSGHVSEDFSEEIRALAESDSLDHIKGGIGSLIHTVEEKVTGTLGRDDEAISQKVNRYIRRHRSDVNLTVGSIAETLGISENYLSTKYKKESGIGLLSAIHRERIREARRLLRSTDAPLREIAEKVGYVNDVALIRSFKRCEGITPGQFRAAMKESSVS